MHECGRRRCIRSISSARARQRTVATNEKSIQILPLECITSKMWDFQAICACRECTCTCIPGPRAPAPAVATCHNPQSPVRSG